MASYGRYCSEEQLDVLLATRRREGAASNHERYHKKTSQVKTLTVSTHDPLADQTTLKD